MANIASDKGCITVTLTQIRRAKTCSTICHTPIIINQGTNSVARTRTWTWSRLRCWGRHWCWCWCRAWYWGWTWRGSWSWLSTDDGLSWITEHVVSLHRIFISCDLVALVQTNVVNHANPARCSSRDGGCSLLLLSLAHGSLHCG